MLSNWKLDLGPELQRTVSEDLWVWAHAIPALILVKWRAMTLLEHHLMLMWIRRLGISIWVPDPKFPHSTYFQNCLGNNLTGMELLLAYYDSSLKKSWDKKKLLNFMPLKPSKFSFTLPNPVILKGIAVQNHATPTSSVKYPVLDNLSIVSIAKPTSTDEVSL